MSACTVCEHRDRLAIEVDLCASGKMAWRVLAETYGLHHLALMQHKRIHMEAKPAALSKKSCSRVSSTVDHELTPVDEVSEPASMTLYTMPQVGENPLRQFTRAVREAQHAYQLAKDDQRMQAHMRDVLAQAFQSDEMGLP